MNPKTVHVIPHTHWDYEWYFTHPESSVQLVYHMDDLFQAFASGQLNQYILDGQLSIVEDYLALAPESKETLQAWVRSGKLKIGPWYTQCDQLIISGESIVRNLLLGIRSARALGDCWMMGYVPDAFGQSIDMPKIYAGFGIHHSVFWRGLSRDVCPWREFNWRSEDGSEIQCYQLRNGYYLAEPQIASLEPDAIVEMVAQDTQSDHVPFPYGADQIKVDLSLQQRIADYNRNTQTGHHFIESTYDALFDDVFDGVSDGINQQGIEPLVLQGEMIDAQFSKIHRSIYSTRYDHKQLNDQVETRMTHVLEPLMLLAQHMGIPYKSSLVNDIWKQLLRCHAHDSAGGCNSDRTNEKIHQRLINTDQMSSANVDFLVRKLSESVVSENGPANVVLYNTLPFPRRERTVIGLDTEQSHFMLQDEDGHEVGYTLLASERRYRGTIRRSVSEHDESLYYYHHQIELVVSLPALGYRCFQLNALQLDDFQVNDSSLHDSHQTGLPVQYLQGSQHQAAQKISNHQYTIELTDGQLMLTEHQSPTRWQNFLFIRDMGDDGDNYDYSPPEQDWVLQLSFNDATTSVRVTPFSQTMTIEGVWQVPANMAERQQQHRSSMLPFRLELTLTGTTLTGTGTDEPPLDIQLEIDNHACDHRMQLVVASDIVTETSIADTPFGTVTRPHLHPRIDDWREQGWKEEPSCIYPMLHHVSLSNPGKTLTLFSCGIKEYEVIQPEAKTQRGDSGMLALTLFRSVGWLGKPDLQRRPGIASGQQFKYIPTPDSQLQQRLQFRVGLALSAEFKPASLMKQWQQFAVSYLSYQQQEVNRFTNTMKYFGVNPLETAIPKWFSLLQIEAPDLVCSAMKWAESDAETEGFVIRLFNPSSVRLEDAGYIQLSEDITAAFTVNLCEEVIERLSVNDGTLTLGGFAPKQVKTFKFCPATQSAL